jgi:hypothetical protein
MKYLFLVLFFLIPSAHAVSLSDVYGTITTECSTDADADTGGHNRLGPLTPNKLFVIYCHDGAGAGVACECLQGDSTVDASSSKGIELAAGEKVYLWVLPGYRYISCVPYADNQKWDACKVN